MKKQAYIDNIFFLQVLVYSTCLLLFVGLLITVGGNMLLSQLFLSSMSETAYVQTFAKGNGILFWMAVVMLFAFTIFCSTFFRWVQLISLNPKPISKKGLFTKFFHAFVSQWGLPILLVIGCWVGSRFLGNDIYNMMSATTVLPTVQQNSYENRADYYPKQPDPIEFSQPTAVHES